MTTQVTLETGLGDPEVRQKWVVCSLTTNGGRCHVSFEGHHVGGGRGREDGEGSEGETDVKNKQYEERVREDIDIR